MSEPEKHLTEQELMAADISSLTNEQLTRRSLMLNLRKAERESEQIEHENERFRTQKEERLRMRRIAIENAEAERRKTAAEQDGCAHKTGGEGLTGFFSGDGAIYGSSTAGLELPTGETYYMCFRCQREWHHPKWPTMWPDGISRTGMRAVVEGLMSLAEYRQQEKEYNEVSRWPRKSFAPWNGEFCAASKFNVPALQMKMAQDTSAFENFVLDQQQKGPGRPRTRV